MDPNQNQFNNQFPFPSEFGYGPANPFSDQNTDDSHQNPFLGQVHQPQQNVYGHTMQQNPAESENRTNEFDFLLDFNFVNDFGGQANEHRRLVTSSGQSQTILPAPEFWNEAEQGEEEQEEEGDEDEDDLESEPEPEPANTKKRKYKSTKTDPAYKEMKGRNKDDFYKKLNLMREFCEKILGDVDDKTQTPPLLDIIEQEMEKQGIESDKIDAVLDGVGSWVQAQRTDAFEAARVPGKPGRKAAVTTAAGGRSGGRGRGNSKGKGKGGK